MALFRYCVGTAICLFVCLTACTQKIYFPAEASQLLQSTAEDMAMLLQRATSVNYAAQSYSNKPLTGIVYVYDSTITDNESCRVRCDGAGYLEFAAAEDNGLVYGIYRYINELGYRFYQPGDVWEIIPALSSIYIKKDTIYSSPFKYRSWFMSGGYNRWLMDDNNAYSWDLYPGDNGHDWSLYRRRNGMLGGYRFAGHRDEILSDEYLSILKNNPCFVAPYNGSRDAGRQSVPDVNNTAAMQLWADAIEQKYTQYANTIYSKKELYANLYRSFNYNNQYIGIEVSDGAHWANSTGGAGCVAAALLKPSDQQFTLANFTAASINKKYPAKRFQLYAYDSHADVPSPAISINSNLDVQVIPFVYQSETSPLGLLNRWYSRYKNISEYHYLNLAQWNGETPSCNLTELINTVQRLKKNHAQGIIWESSPAKFATLPYLLAANESLLSDKNVDDVLKDFTEKLFGKASGIIYDLLKLWSDEKTAIMSSGYQDSRYKMPLYFNVVNKAAAVGSDDIFISRRLLELKAYLHYMLLYYDWMMDQRANAAKKDKAAALCEYLAKTNRLKLVNSYALISVIANKYDKTDPFYISYNPISGTAYQSGKIKLITEDEIRRQFIEDYNQQQSYAKDFNFLDAVSIKNLLATNDLVPLEKINVKLSYTFGKDYYGSTKYYFIAPSAGSISIKYMPAFNLADNGYINFTVECIDDQKVLKDFSLSNKSSQGVLDVPIPAAGNYKLTITSKYKASVQLAITTNGNFFYNTGTSFSNVIENYKDDTTSFPGFFYIPVGVSKLYFDVNNSNPGGKGFLSPSEISSAFVFRNNEGKQQDIQLVTNTDSAFFYIDVPAKNSGTFWTAVKTSGLRLGLSNLSNIWWFAKRKTCDALDFTISVIQNKGACITRLTASPNLPINKWDVSDGHETYQFNNQQQVDLPAGISRQSVIKLSNGNYCSVSHRLADNAEYLKQMASCAAGAVLPPDSKLLVYPNPGTGIYKCKMEGAAVSPEEIIIFNASGNKVAQFANTPQFDITKLTGGIYFYQLTVNKTAFRGKLIKQ